MQCLTVVRNGISQTATDISKLLLSIGKKAESRKIDLQMKRKEYFFNVDRETTD